MGGKIVVDDMGGKYAIITSTAAVKNEWSEADPCLGFLAELTGSRIGLDISVVGYRGWVNK